MLLFVFSHLLLFFLFPGFFCPNLNLLNSPVHSLFLSSKFSPFVLHFFEVFHIFISFILFCLCLHHFLCAFFYFSLFSLTFKIVSHFYCQCFPLLLYFSYSLVPSLSLYHPCFCFHSGTLEAQLGSVAESAQGSASHGWIKC